MIVRRFFVLAAVLALALILLGCRSSTPPPPPPPPPPSPPSNGDIYIPPPPGDELDVLMPLTTAVLRRFGESEEVWKDKIGSYQLILFGRITLEREYTNHNSAVESSGRIRFEDVRVREVITINDRTEGVALELKVQNNEIIVQVSFEDKDDKYHFVFVNSEREADDLFYLTYAPNGRTQSDIRGTLIYGGELYNIRFTGERSPYLLIRLTHRDVEEMEARTVGGRRVN
jgi:hypothetical protein